jgi:hypothetical protein
VHKDNEQWSCRGKVRGREATSRDTGVFSLSDHQVHDFLMNV